MTAPLMLLVIMIASGAVGGLASLVLEQDVPADGKQSESVASRVRAAIRRVFVGIVAAFTVPLFLSLAQSSIVKDILQYNQNGDPSKAPADSIYDMFLFSGFCLLAAFVARTFLPIVANQALSLAKEAKERASHAETETKSLAQQVKSAVTAAGDTEEKVENLLAQEDEPAQAEREGPSQPKVQAFRALIADELSVLRALTSKPYKRRTASGVSRDAEIELGAARELLGKLVHEGLVAEITSKKTGNLLYKLTALGTYVLGHQGAAKP